MAAHALYRRAIPAAAAITRWQAPDGWSHRRFDWAAPANVRPRGSLLFQTGRGDMFEKYLEAFAHWHVRGWSITAFDWRGQGGSGRCTPAGDCGHIDRFETYLDDLAAFWTQWDAEGPRVLIGHSMGGHLALRAVVEERVDPVACVLVAPMLGLRAPIGPRFGERMARLRRALSLAIDREFIAERVWAGTMLPAYGVIPPHIGNYGERAELDFKAASPLEREDEAKRLMAAAGYGPGMPLRLALRYNRSDNNRRTIAAIAEQWAAIGVETSLIETDSAAHFAHLREGGDFDVARAGWIGDYSDPQNFLFLLQSDNKGLNYANYTNPAYDALMRDAERETDLKKRAELLAKAERILADEHPYVGILYFSNRNLISNKVEGYIQNLRGANASRFVSLKP